MAISGCIPLSSHCYASDVAEVRLLGMMKCDDTEFRHALLVDPITFLFCRLPIR